jgi:hypothetical protein
LPSAVFFDESKCKISLKTSLHSITKICVAASEALEEPKRKNRKTETGTT